MQLILCSEMLSQLQNWIIKELIFSYRSYWSMFELSIHEDTIYEVWLCYLFICAHKGVLVRMQGCIRACEWFLYIRLIDELNSNIVN